VGGKKRWEVITENPRTRIPPLTKAREHLKSRLTLLTRVSLSRSVRKNTGTSIVEGFPKKNSQTVAGHSNYLAICVEGMGVQRGLRPLKGSERLVPAPGGGVSVVSNVSASRLRQCGGVQENKGTGSPSPCQLRKSCGKKVSGSGGQAGVKMRERKKERAKMMTDATSASKDNRRPCW